MRFNEALHEREAETQAAVRSGLGSIFLSEPLEDEREKVRADAMAVIVNVDDDVIGYSVAADFNHAA